MKQENDQFYLVLMVDGTIEMHFISKTLSKNANKFCHLNTLLYDIPKTKKKKKLTEK